MWRERFDSVYVAGEWVKPANERAPVLNPATEEVIGLAPWAGMAEMDAAIGAARDAFDRGPWPRMSPGERGQILRALHKALETRKGEIIELLIREAGAIQALATDMQCAQPLQAMLHTIDLGERYRDMPLPIGNSPDQSGGQSFSGGVIRREPAGVVGAITPYNFPFLLNLQKLVPALITGNTVVLKPSPFTPLSALVIAEAVAEAGLPRGVVNILPGGTDIGELLTTDPRVDLVTFTGSDATGILIARQSAGTLKRVHLELGGKSAHIVRGDAHLEDAARHGMRFILHCGQGCSLPTRHIVHNSVRKRYVEILADHVAKVKVGDPADPSSTMGPLIRETQRARAERFVREGLDSGARLVTGGKRPAAFSKGFFFEPTIFDDVDNASSLAQEEVFGPVVAVIGFDTDEEAIRLANDSRFGLAGNVFSADLTAAFNIAAAMRTGTVRINGGGGPPGLSAPPSGGFKYSGIGREHGEEGLNAFTELKALSFRQSR